MRECKRDQNKAVSALQCSILYSNVTSGKKLLNASTSSRFLRCNLLDLPRISQENLLIFLLIFLQQTLEFRNSDLATLVSGQLHVQKN